MSIIHDEGRWCKRFLILSILSLIFFHSRFLGGRLLPTLLKRFVRSEQPDSLFVKAIPSITMGAYCDGVSLVGFVGIGPSCATYEPRPQPVLLAAKGARPLARIVL